jgi:hypothetical protein
MHQYRKSSIDNFLCSLFRRQTQTKERSVGLTPSLVTAYLDYYWY